MEVALGGGLTPRHMGRGDGLRGIAGASRSPASGAGLPSPGPSKAGAPAAVERNWHPAAEAVSLEFPVAGLAPGRYLLYVTAEDRVSKTLAHVQGALVITED